MVCQNSGALDFGNPCVRTTWSALVPTIFVAVMCTIALFPKTTQSALKPVAETFPHFITLREAEALGNNDDQALAGADIPRELQVEEENTVPLWRTTILSFLALFETLFWLGVASYTFVAMPEKAWDGVSSLLIALTWLYATCRPVVRPTPTAPYDLFVLYIIHLVMGIVLLGGNVHAKDVYDIPLPPTVVITGQALNLVVVLILLYVIINMPVGIPSNTVKKDAIVSLI